MKSKRVIIVVDSVYKKAERVFGSVDDFHLIKGPEEENLLTGMVDAEKAFAVVLGTTRYSGALYEKMTEGGILARFGVGCDGLDFEKAKNHNLYIINTPGVLDQTVAEYTVFLAAELLRKIGQVNELMKKDTWKTFLGNDLQGKTWAIIGFGHIGKRLGKILSHGFGARVLGLNTGKSINIENQAEYGLEQLFTDYSQVVSQADIVSLHLPANAETLHYMDKTRMLQVNPGAILINTARGSLVEEGTLYDMLLNGTFAGAGLDVFENEPYVPVTPGKDLRKLPNVILSPHLGSSTIECCDRMAKSVLTDLRMAREAKYDRMHIVQKIKND